jgi:hypothetical protein
VTSIRFPFGGAKCRECLSGRSLFFQFRGYCSRFPEEMLKCLIALGREGRLFDIVWPTRCRASWPCLPIGRKVGCRLRVVFQLFLPSSPRCILAVLYCVAPLGSVLFVPAVGLPIFWLWLWLSGSGASLVVLFCLRVVLRLCRRPFACCC